MSIEFDNRPAPDIMGECFQQVRDGRVRAFAIVRLMADGTVYIDHAINAAGDSIMQRTSLASGARFLEARLLERATMDADKTIPDKSKLS